MMSIRSISALDNIIGKQNYFKLQVLHFIKLSMFGIDMSFCRLMINLQDNLNAQISYKAIISQDI